MTSLPGSLALFHYDAPRAAFEGSKLGRAVMVAGLRLEALGRLVSATLPSDVADPRKVTDVRQAVLQAAAEAYERFKYDRDTFDGGDAERARCMVATNQSAPWPVCEDEVRDVVHATWQVLGEAVSNVSGSQSQLLAAASKLCASLLRRIDVAHLDADDEERTGGATSQRPISKVEHSSRFYGEYTKHAAVIDQFGVAIATATSDLHTNPLNSHLATVLSYADMSDDALSRLVETKLSQERATPASSEIASRFCGDLNASNYAEGGTASEGSSYCQYGLALPHTLENTDEASLIAPPEGECFPSAAGYAVVSALAALVGVGLLIGAGYYLYYAQRRSSTSKSLLAKSTVSVRDRKASEYIAQVEVVDEVVEVNKD